MTKDKLLVFDLDGTLIDSAIDIHHSLLFILDKYDKLEVNFEQTKRHIGEGLKALIESIFTEELKTDTNFPETLYDDFREFYAEICLDNTYVYPGVHEFLKSCDYKIATLSNKPIRFVNQTMSALGLLDYDWIEVFGGDSFSTNKPNTQGIEYLMKKAEVLPQNTLMIGDGIPDVQVALNAKTKLLVTEFGFSSLKRLKETGATMSFSHYRQLPKILNTIFT